jgi:hypothetical protein
MLSICAAMHIFILNATSKYEKLQAPTRPTGTTAPRLVALHAPSRRAILGNPRVIVTNTHATVNSNIHATQGQVDATDAIFPIFPIFPDTLAKLRKAPLPVFHFLPLIRETQKIANQFVVVVFHLIICSDLRTLCSVFE